MLNNNLSVVTKTTAGVAAVQPQNNELLPREARNLLILIDGKKTMDQYRTQLNNMKMFKEVGGVDQYFQLLLDMELIQLESVDSNIPTVKDTKIPTLKAVTPPKRETKLTRVPTQTTDEVSQTQFSNNESRSEYSTSIFLNDSFNNTESLGVLNGKISAKMATYIEQHAQPDDTWSFLMKLESCESDTELLLFLRTLAQGNHGRLSRRMTSLIKSLKKAKLI